MDWFEGYTDLWGTYSVLTYPWATTPSREKVIEHGKNFGLRLNRCLFGDYFSRRGKGLASVFTIEGRDRYHLNYLTQKHRLVTPELITNAWLKTLYGKKPVPHKNLDNPALVNVKNVYDSKRLLKYIFKEATWEYGPEVYIPKALLRAVETQ